jgi:hypothetical protein
VDQPLNFAAKDIPIIRKRITLDLLNKVIKEHVGNEETSRECVDSLTHENPPGVANHVTARSRSRQQKSGLSSSLVA